MAYNGPKITDEQLADAVASSFSMSEALRRLNRHPGGTSHAHYTKRARELGLPMDHFRRRGGDIKNKQKKTPKQILTFEPEATRRTKTMHLRRALLEIGVEHKCVECGLSGIWRGKPLLLHVDHIDGNWRNNLRSNLRFLCPNCHSQTETYGYRGVSKSVVY